MNAFFSRRLQCLFFAAAVASAGCSNISQQTFDIDGALGEYETLYNQPIRIEIKTATGLVRTGGAAWIGNGEVLTAYHLFDAPNENPPFRLSESDVIMVTIGETAVAARLVTGGSLNENHDLALLKINDELPNQSELRVPPVCAQLERIGVAVYVTASDQTYRTFTSPVRVGLHQGRMYAQGITAIVSHGVSGSPVFDHGRECLAGIVSYDDFGNRPLTAEEEKCKSSTLLNQDPHMRSTCAVSPVSIFSNASGIRSFLEFAHKGQR